MKKKIAGITSVIMTFLSLNFFSCQPEVQPYTQRTDSTTVGVSLLLKVDCRRGNDTLGMTFSYDNQKRWSGAYAWVVLQGDTIRIKASITRDAAGYITKIITADSTDYPRSWDVITQTVLHDATGKYTTAYTSDLYYSQFVTNPQPQDAYKDTIDFTYDNQGNIVYKRYRQYSDIEKYTFGSNNLNKYLNMYGSRSNPDSTVMQYDTKQSPYKFGNESLLTEIPYFFSLNNMIRFTQYTDVGNINGQCVIAYNYNTANMPVTAVLTALPSNILYTFNYHYQ